MGSKERLYADVIAVHPGVTGSCNLVVVKYPDGETCRFIVDCGLFQEKEYSKYNDIFPFYGENIEFCMITHVHVDHVGRLPLLAKKGFRGNIYSSIPTAIFAPFALSDSYKVLKDLARVNHTKELYSEVDVERAVEMFEPCEFDTTIQINDRIKATFFKNGHLIGAAVILLQISYPGYEDINLLFTGDYNNRNIFFDVPSLPKWVTELPITIVQESTYGNMDSCEVEECFEKNILDCLTHNGSVTCMAFSLGRSQEILHILKTMQDEGKLSDKIPIYFDGKLAHLYTNCYLTQELGIKDEMKDFLPKNLIFVDKTSRRSVIDSTEQKIVVTTSGMGTHGPAPLYISENITRDNHLLHFTGYTVEGSMGRELKEKEMGDTVRIGSIIRRKRAKVEYTTEFSAHAKADEMIDFLKQFSNLKLVLVNHGEPETKLQFAERIVQEIDPKCVAVLNRDYFFRVCPYGLVRQLPTKFD